MKSITSARLSSVAAILLAIIFTVFTVRAQYGQVQFDNFGLPSQPLTVNKTADTNDGSCDSGDCSLREAIAAANASSANDSISFAILATDAGCVNSICTITLTSGALGIANNGTLTITNTDAKSLAISGNNQSGVFNVSSSGANLTITNLIITGGRVTSGGSNFGGGISIFGSIVSVNNCTITGNNVVGGNEAFGGGISAFNNSTLTITNSTITGNSASGASFGNNLGGGISSVRSTTTINNTTVTNNSASSGGGIFLENGSVNVLNSIVSGNSASSGSDVSGTLTTNQNNLIGGNALLAPLGFYGGRTMTHALMSNSPAINAGNSATSAALDQRGAARVGTPDIGAFEVNNSQNGGTFVAALPNATVNSPYSFTLVPATGTATYCTNLANLPPGISSTNVCTAPVKAVSERKGLAPAAVITIAGTPTMTGIYGFTTVVGSGGNSTSIDYSLRVLVPTAASVSIAGRVLTSEGRGVRSARVVITDSNGRTWTATTGTYGSYRFEGVEAGRTYVITVLSRRFVFTPRSVTLNDAVEDLDFVADPV